MPVRANGNEDTIALERLLLDSGAECCVCPEDYTPGCPIEPLPDGRTPNLVTVTGNPMTVWLQLRPLHLPQKPLDNRKPPRLGHSISGGQPRQTISIYGHNVSFDYRRSTYFGEVITALPARPIVGSTFWSTRLRDKHGTYRTTTWLHLS